jgi:molybdopterin synthase catalytic subunit
VATESLVDVIRSLTEHEQEAVRQFIGYLRQREDSGGARSLFTEAADEFIAKHPELLQRLAR